MDFFETLIRRWRSALTYGDEEAQERIWTSISEAFGQDMAFFTYKAAKILMRDPK